MAVNQLPGAEIGGVGLFSGHLAGALSLEGHDLLLLGGSERTAAGASRVEEVESVAPGVRSMRLLRAPAPARLGPLAGIVNPAVDALLDSVLLGQDGDLERSRRGPRTS